MRKLRNVHVLATSLVLGIGTLGAATTKTFVIGEGSFRDPSWQSSGTFSFNEPFARLESTSYRFFGGATISETIYNPNSFNALAVSTGSANFVIERNGRVIDSLTVSLRGSTVIPPRTSSLVGDSDLVIKNGTLSAENSSGNFVIRSSGGSGPNLKTIGDFSITYTFDLIGDTPDDPIAATMSLGEVRNFSAIPSGRWFELASTAPTLIESTSTDTFRQFAASFTGAGGEYRLIVDGVDFGMKKSNETVELPVGTKTIGISDVEGTVGSAKITSNMATSNFRIVPEPSSMLLLSVGCWATFSLRRRSF